MFIRAKALHARVEALAASTEHSPSAIVNEPVDNQAISYIAAIGVGTPPTTVTITANNAEDLSNVAFRLVDTRRWETF
jgi:hypothetical protein